jgi:hypothetical protein
MNLLQNNIVRLSLWLSGLAAVGYIVWDVSGDLAFTAAAVVFARWLKPFKAV